MSTSLSVLNKKFIFFKIKDSKNLSLLQEHYTIKTDIVIYYILPDSTELIPQRFGPCPTLVFLKI